MLKGNVMRLMASVAAIAAVVALLATLVSGSVLTAQQVTPDGQLGGGVELEGTDFAETPPPSPTATPGTPAPDAASPVPHDGTPVTVATSLPEAPGPDECTVTPRTLDELNRLLNGQGAAQPLATPSAEHWTVGDSQAATEIVRELVACANAGNQLAALALLSDELAIDALTGPPDALPTVARLLLADRPQIERFRIAALSPQEPGIVLLELAPLRYPALTPEQRTLRFTLALGLDGWRITAISDATT